MLGNQGTYATKKRKKPALKPKKISDVNEVVKSNPSKRHRDRLNLELDRLTDLLPFSNEVRSRLDKLSVLRLSVGYLRVKSYLKASTKSNGNSLTFPAQNGQNKMTMDGKEFSEGELLLQALNGFVIVVTSDGLVFYASTTIKDYLGFHQSDVVHQSVFDLIHTDDRELFKEQLHFAMNPAAAAAGGNGLQGTTMLYNPERLPPENSSFLERSFMCRFRCLLDNSSGFLTLKFQGRLKYLHGQNIIRDNPQNNKYELALFAIAIPIQPPLIVEIRAKMLLFQTRHKLDFTPTAVDSRGKLVLGYTETEISMKGSGYQFIHAADMMYCATNHMRMIKTGETGLTVFRLLSKTNKWVWVKSNAKLIYKGGRPEFIIAYQKAIDNTEGEEYLRQRNMEIPFSFSTGEGVLYNTGPTVDLSVFQFNKKFNLEDMGSAGSPGSLVDCFRKQNVEAYNETLESSTVDQVFSESGALITVPSDPWQKNGVVNTTGPDVIVKKETKQSVMAVIDNLEKLVHSGDFFGALQNLDLSNDDLREWEDAIKELGPDQEDRNNVRSDLDSMLSNDIFDYIDSIFQEKGGDSVNSNNPPNQFPSAPSELCEPGLFNTQNPNHSFAPKNGLYFPLEDSVSTMMDTSPIVNGTQKLSHQGPLPKHTDANLPPLQELQLHDIFSASIEIPDIIVPDAPNGNALPPLQPYAQGAYSHVEGPQGISGQKQPKQSTVWPQNGFKSQIAMNSQMPQSSGPPPNHMAPGVKDILPPLIPCKNSPVPPSPIVTHPFVALFPQQMSPFDTNNVQQWPQSNQQKLPCNGGPQSGHAPMPICNGQSSQNQTFPHNSPCQRNVSSMSHTQQGGMAFGLAATERTCIFDQHFSSKPAGSNMLSLSGSAVLREAEATTSQSALQGLHCFQWRQVESTLSASAIAPDNGDAFTATKQALTIQRVKENHQQSQDERLLAELNGIFATPPHDVAMYPAE